MLEKANSSSRWHSTVLGLPSAGTSFLKRMGGSENLGKNWGWGLGGAEKEKSLRQKAIRDKNGINRCQRGNKVSIEDSGENLKEARESMESGRGLMTQERLEKKANLELQCS